MSTAPTTLESFTKRYPWPQRLRSLGRPLEWLWQYPLTVEANVLWPHLIDTSRLNRALGLNPMHFEERDGVLHGNSVNGGVRHEWIEEPWTWNNATELIAIRNYSRGFAHVARVIYRFLTPTSQDSHGNLLVYFGWIPRGLIGHAALRLGIPPIGKAYQRVLKELQQEADKQRPTIYQASAPPLNESRHQRLDQLQTMLLTEDCPQKPLEKLVELIQFGDNLDLYRIQPRRLAHQWAIDEASVLKVCLRATRIGLLELSWDVICPHCRGARSESARLADVESHDRCDACDIDFKTNRENSIEVTFHIHPSIRDVPKIYYCSAEPATKQHIKLQHHLDENESRDIHLRIPPGRYRMRNRGDELSGFLSVGHDRAPLKLDWDDRSRLGELSSGPDVELHLKNHSNQRALFIIEDVHWTDEALRPNMLFALQEFRDLFSEEYMAAGVQLSVGEQTLLFTDMIGSTDFYRKLGDPAAFVRVREHFTEVFAIINKRQGAVVKTIGDAVMAVFSNPLDAVRASEELCLSFGSDQPGRDSLVRIRVSLHCGPCIAVNLNTGIDYFGSTVNIAAKLQACVEAGEVALSDRVFSSTGVADYIRNQAYLTEARCFEHPSLDPID